MASLVMRNLRKSFDTTHVIKGLDMEVKQGEFVVFVGPSGCGKSTLLRMIAGLEDITSGTLEIEGQLANNLPAAQRGIAMVFQSYALYPHMTVAENMGFALKMAKVPAAEIDRAVRRAAEVLDITRLLARKPGALSGGQRQRVAIGRAIVREPKVFLFDEPLSNLDAALRVQMRMELARLHKELGTTMVYVTHDQVEAMTLGDRIAVFNDGYLEQIGTPTELYNTPRNTFVAGFLGSPKINLLPCTHVEATREGNLATTAGGQKLNIEGIALPEGFGQAATLAVRPDHWRLVTPDQGLAANVELTENLGDALLLHTAAQDGTRITVKISPDLPTPLAGESVFLQPVPGKAIWFGADGNALNRPG
ncbi:sn-glycerol-3-phosphate ABC transporter ATP-binding protein UgpC [Silvimonas sp.]|uniref:ABC transporter ATP-binding protein n=1 Tax=Silvimonas sp. TaxID=2650811 RepID=UPI0028424DE9|nr:sn-glycerol-3-phosphate ABC transporter ATP-binding protein UgpC [Silvimonas sp.]MDR3429712.1 sn-glycerol-3-phosphate ABC transporter ATP-binding protein UgpC [Silvimonas sp.]